MEAVTSTLQNGLKKHSGKEQACSQELCTQSDVISLCLRSCKEFQELAYPELLPNVGSQYCCNETEKKRVPPLIISCALNGKFDS